MLKTSLLGAAFWSFPIGSLGALQVLFLPTLTPPRMLGSLAWKGNGYWPATQGSSLSGYASASSQEQFLLPGAITTTLASCCRPVARMSTGAAQASPGLASISWGELTERIRQIHAGSRGIYGPPRVQAELAAGGVEESRSPGRG